MSRNKEIEGVASYVSTHKKKCKYCGNPVFIIESFDKEKILCYRCGHFVYKKDVDEFKDRLKQRIRKEEENDTYKD